MQQADLSGQTTLRVGLPRLRRAVTPTGGAGRGGVSGRPVRSTASATLAATVRRVPVRVRVAAAEDESALQRMVGATTWVRGRSYASRGAVRTYEADEDGLLSGEVQGTRRAPYQVVAELKRAAGSGRLTGFKATCTCPVGNKCKHAVALVLTAWRAGTSPDVAEAHRSKPAKQAVSKGRGEAAGRPDVTQPLGRPNPAPAQIARGQVPVPSVQVRSWEAQLRALLGAEERPSGPRALGAASSQDVAQMALQLEMVPDRPGTGTRSASGRPGVKVAPVRLNSLGNWSKSGLSWGDVEHFGSAWAKASVPQGVAALLKELLALSRVSTGRSAYYSYGSEAIWLEDINSRRVWDLFRHAAEVGLPLLSSGRQGQPVTLSPAGATVAVDLSASGAGLDVRLRAEADGQEVDLRRCVLVGKPAHGLVWQDDGDQPGARLWLARLVPPGPGDLRALMENFPVKVPGRDKARFLRDAVPFLRRRFVLTTTDGTVELPEQVAQVLVLSAAHREGHVLELDWALGEPASTRLTPLAGAVLGPADTVARDAITAATAVLAHGASEISYLEGTVAHGPAGPALAPRARLEGMAAARFVSDILPVLAQIAGLEVRHEGTVPDYREATEAPLVSVGGASSRDGDWLDLSVTVTVEGEDVPFYELFVALAKQEPYLVLPSGTYFSLDRPELRQLADLIAEARSLNDAMGSQVRLSRFQASLWEDLCEVATVTAQAGEWEQSVRALAQAGERADFPVPAAIEATLRPYQQAGFNWLAFLSEHRLGGILADDMGLGKTLQAMALMCRGRENSEGPYLVVAPTSVVGNWADECAKFAPGLDVVTVTETTARRGVGLGELAEKASVVVTSYALFRLEYEGYASVDWAGAFFDEAQFAKNATSQTYRCAKLLPAGFKVAMTGTPMENNLMELWSLLSITAPGLFPRADLFREQYALPIEKHGDEEALARLRRRVRPLMLRRTKEQVVAELPAKLEQVVELDLNSKHKKIYQGYLQRERQTVLGLLGDMSKNRFQIFRSLTLLRQASLDVSLVDPKHASVPSTKLDALTAMLTEVVSEGHRVLVFSQFTRFLSMARDRAEEAGIAHCYLDGSTRRRAAVISEFRSGDAPVFFISLKAGGFGLNLTEADYCILLDPWWNPATEAQAVDRAHRIGQSRNVIVYRMVSRGTIEEKVMALKAKKAALFASIVDGGGAQTGALTADEVRSLVT